MVSNTTKQAQQHLPHLKQINLSVTRPSTSSRVVKAAGKGKRETSQLLRTIPSQDPDAFVPSSSEEEILRFSWPLMGYRLIYVIQGIFLGLLGPSLGYFSHLSMTTSNINSPVASFGPMFAAHGGSALVLSFMSELVLNFAVEMDLMKLLITLLLFSAGAWLVFLPIIAALFGSLGVSLYFIFKGTWTALLNISLNRCCLWIAGEDVASGRRLITSMNICFGLGTIIGPLLALGADFFQHELQDVYKGLAISLVLPLLLILCFPSPRSPFGRDAGQNHLQFEDPTRRVPTVPSPIVGGVFLHEKHLGRGSANTNPDTYDPLTNLVILFVTIFATVLFGIQLGLAAFLFDYVGHVLTSTDIQLRSGDPLIELSPTDVFRAGCVVCAIFWLSMTGSYAFFSQFMFHSRNLYSIFHLSLLCLVASFGILFGPQVRLMWFLFCVVLFGVSLSPLFTLCIHCLTRIINPQLIRRVSSLIVFGAGMGEIFLPVLMGFFMGDYSGIEYGSVAVSYIIFILSLTLVSVSGMLLMMVQKNLDQVNKAREEEAVKIMKRRQKLHAGGDDQEDMEAGRDDEEEYEDGSVSRDSFSSRGRRY